MKTQCDRILHYLRRVKKATNVDLMMLGTGRVQILCPHKRIEELTLIGGFVKQEDWRLPVEKIVRHYIKSRGGARVVQYHLVRV